MMPDPKFPHAPLTPEECASLESRSSYNAAVCSLPKTTLLRLLSAARRDYRARVRRGDEKPERDGKYLVYYEDGPMFAHFREGRWADYSYSAEGDEMIPPDSWTELPEGWF